MKFFKNKKGFTLVELVVVIAILGILAGIAIPRFMDATASARGSKIVADMRTVDSAIMMYYAKVGTAPTMTNLTTNGAYLASEPKPATGNAIVTNNSGSQVTHNITSTAYTVATVNGTARCIIGTTGTNTVDVILAATSAAEY